MHRVHSRDATKFESASKPFAVLLGLIAKKVTARERLLPILAHADFGNGGDVASREPLRGDGPFGDGTGDYTLPEPHSVFQLIAITYARTPFKPGCAGGTAEFR